MYVKREDNQDCIHKSQKIDKQIPHALGRGLLPFGKARFLPLFMAKNILYRAKYKL
jgi:hypothetical protein